MLNDLFTYANITLCEQHKDPETDEPFVVLELEVRRTGARFLVRGDDIEDAEDLAWRIIEDQVWTVDSILREYGLTIDELRSLVDFAPKEEVTSQYDEDLNEPLPPPINQILSEGLTVVAAAQPFIAVDAAGNVYVTHEISPLPKD